jgi:hypothetical protein
MLKLQIPRENRMNMHKNARLTRPGRERIVRPLPNSARRGGLAVCGGAIPTPRALTKSPCLPAGIAYRPTALPDLAARSAARAMPTFTRSWIMLARTRRKCPSLADAFALEIAAVISDITLTVVHHGKAMTLALFPPASLVNPIRIRLSVGQSPRVRIRLLSERC